ncbi:MAG: hypothetical protein ACLTZM_23105 [Ruminococcus sp.]
MKTHLLEIKKVVSLRLEDKSLGCTQKSGSAPVMGVLSYGEPVKVQRIKPVKCSWK